MTGGDSSDNPSGLLTVHQSQALSRIPTGRLSPRMDRRHSGEGLPSGPVRPPPAVPTKKTPQFILGQTIGKGSFATVYRGQLQGRSAPVAIKCVHRTHLNRDKRLLENFEAEMAILKKMSHPHVVSLIDVVQTAKDYNLIMEFCALGDLSRFIRRKDASAAQVLERYPSNHYGGLNETLTRHFLVQLASSLEFLRSHNLIHRDIKPQNLLLCDAPSSPAAAREAGYVGIWFLPTLKLADFGFARILPAASMAETLCGSPLYMAPEILRYEKYNAKADLWSVGAVVFEMVTGRPPFPAANHIELLKRIDQAQDQISLPSGVAPDIDDLIRALLKRMPSERLGFDGFFAHSALKLDSDIVQGRELVSPEPEASKDNKVNSRSFTLTPSQSPQTGDASRTSSFVFKNEPGRGWGRNLSHTSSASDDHSGPASGAGSGIASAAVSEGSDDYVMVSRRTIEVNSAADRMTQAVPQTEANNTQRRRLSSIAYGASPTNVLAQTLLRSSARLFGSKADSQGNVTLGSHPVSSLRPEPPIGEEPNKKVLDEIESGATIGKVVSLYAEVKFTQLEAVSDAEHERLARESLALYVKALSIFAHTMDIAGEWWSHTAQESVGASPGVSALVQWVRDKFNECVSQAEEVRSRLGASEDTCDESAERLIFERALEMARAAAVQELAQPSDLAACELNYGTALWMLRALLIKGSPEDDISADDRIVVTRLMGKIEQRVAHLKVSSSSSSSEVRQ